VARLPAYRSNRNWFLVYLGSCWIVGGITRAVIGAHTTGGTALLLGVGVVLITAGFVALYRARRPMPYCRLGRGRVGRGQSDGRSHRSRPRPSA
jgi:hypothetical protein